MPKAPLKAKEYQEKTESIRSKKNFNFRPRLTENTFSSRSIVTNSISPSKERHQETLSVEDEEPHEHPEIAKIRAEFDHYEV